MRNCAPPDFGGRRAQSRRLGMADRLTTYVLRILLVLTAGALGVAVAVHVGDGRLTAAGFVAAYLMWMFSETRTTAGTPRQSAAENRTLVPYAVARVTTAVVAAYSQPVASPQVAIACAAVFLSGVAVRAWAIHELGAQYSHRVVRIPENQLISSGPYRVLRHPAYAGMLLANVGFVAYFAGPASIAALSLLVAAILWRIRVEENVLGESREYRVFARGRDRLLPGVW
ncbi:hypothetical protein DVS77_09785 [Mycolicibacterium moriokaense]|nr:hypothetical protein DVS77_09785 [Mycolicibacterium moriokaense]